METASPQAPLAVASSADRQESERGAGVLPACAACEDLISFLIATRPFLCHLGRPLQVALQVSEVGGPSTLASVYTQVMHAVANRLKFPPPQVTDAARSDANALEQLVASQIRALLGNLPEWDEGLVDRAAEEALRQYGALGSRLREILTDGDVRLQAYFRGDPAAEAVMIVGPCGIPAAILDRWATELSRRYFVLTMESRGFSAEDTHPAEYELTLQAQVNDVFAVLNHFDVARVHLMGVCGGAVTALHAAARDANRTESISLWHGDYNIEDKSALTRYQKDLRWLMGAAARSRGEAASLRHLLTDGNALARTRSSLAHLLLYPYSTTELLYRYAHANGAIMNDRVLQVADSVRQPALVVTSDADETAHPAGSKRVSRQLPRATLSISSGEHLSCFDAESHAVRLACEFIDTHRGARPAGSD